MRGARTLGVRFALAVGDREPHPVADRERDGHRHARLSLTSRAALDGGRVQCSGQYRRIAGYSQRELRNRNARVSVIYAPLGNTMRAETVVVRTSYGKVSMHRR